MTSSAVLDTCALLDLLLAGYRPPVHLPPPWTASAISWCEIAWKHRLGRLDLGDRDRFLADLERVGVRVEPIDHRLAVAAVDLAWDHRDPADRLIVALAQRLELPLVTRDEVIRGFYGKSLW